MELSTFEYLTRYNVGMEVIQNGVKKTITAYNLWYTDIEALNGYFVEISSKLKNFKKFSVIDEKPDDIKNAEVFLKAIKRVIEVRKFEDVKGLIDG